MKENPTYKYGRAGVWHGPLLNAAVFLSQTIVLAFFVFSCSPEEGSLEAALNAAERNRGELEKVLGHYKNDSAKLAAAQFLIENLPEHYSYRGKGIDNYYATARALFLSGLSPWEQYDSLLHIYKEKYAGLEDDTISDAKIITAKYLIKNIDQAFDQWRSHPWADHLTFDEFCEWLLPYKAVELQSLDSWRDSLYEAFTSDLRSMPHDDDAYGTAVNAANTVNCEIQRKIRPFGIYSERVHPFLSAGTLPHFTFGVCTDYVVLSVLTLRSVGIPCVIDETPYWGRFRAGHSWVTILNSRGEELTSEWDVSSAFGTAFFTDKRIPKVYRNTFAVNRERKRYMEESEYKYPFSLCQTDVTSRYFRTADIEVPLPDSFTPSETYAYIATFTGTGSDKGVRRGSVTWGATYYI